MNVQYILKTLVSMDFAMWVNDLVLDCSSEFDPTNRVNLETNPGPVKFDHFDPIFSFNNIGF